MASSVDNIFFNDIPGAISSTLTATNLNLSTYYRAIVTNSVCSSDTTASEMVTVDPASVAGNILGATTVCTGVNSTVLT
ncbi:hypothetical protein EMGBS15_05170 [Filimonas sp.]|nr:hypothetical protein EMGBS15_05170 [Filimonas sp.]